MSCAAWVFAVLGVIIGGAIEAAVVWDIYALHAVPKRITVSSWILAKSEQDLLVPLLVVGFLCFVGGMIAGHVLVPQGPTEHTRPEPIATIPYEVGSSNER